MDKITSIEVSVEDAGGNKTLTMYCRPRKIEELLREHPSLQLFIDKHKENFSASDEEIS